MPSAAGPSADEAGWWARLRRRSRSRRYVVRDASMVPTLLPNDRLLVDPGAYRWRSPARGEIVVLRDPEWAGRLLIKRITRVPGDRAGPDGPLPQRSVYVIGDSPDASRDSRSFGPVPVGRIVGRAWFCYLPKERRGPIGPDTVK